MYPRLCKPLLSQSFFLFGSRQSGKSTLLQQLFKNHEPVWIDLLDEEEYQRFLLHPQLLEERLSPSLPEKSWVVIDEVQRVPALLNSVHRLIEERHLNFALTGSSARKLKRGGANLLAARAFTNSLHPLTCFELKEDFDLFFVLNWGALPKIFSLQSDLERQEFLRAYSATYLQQEIKEEQVVRKIGPFLKFLEVAAQMNGQIMNYAKIGRDAGVDAKAVERFFEILGDTLICHFLPPFYRSIRRRETRKSKFFLFDLGVKKALEHSLRLPLQKGTYEFGKAFEHFFIEECFRLNDYFRKDYQFSYYRTKDDLEVDLIVERPGEPLLLIEIKSSERVDEKEFGRLRALKKDLDPCEFWVASCEKQSRYFEFFTIHPWKKVLDSLFAV